VTLLVASLAATPLEMRSGAKIEENRRIRSTKELDAAAMRATGLGCRDSSIKG